MRAVYASKDRIASVSFSHVVDELLNKDRLPNTGSPEQTDLSSPRIRRKQVDHLDACLENLWRRRLVNKLRRRRVDGRSLARPYGPTLVNRLPDDVHDTAEGLGPNRHLNRRCRIDDLLSSDLDNRSATNILQAPQCRPWQLSAPCSRPGAVLPRERACSVHPAPRVR